MKKLFKIFLSVTLCLGLFSNLNYSVDAASLTTENAAGEIHALNEQLYDKGLTEIDIKSLCNQGFSREEQLKMSDSELANLLRPTYTEPMGNSRASTVTVRNVPDDVYGVETATFLANCGFVNGDFYLDNPGSVYKARIDIFSNYVFNGANCNKYYFLFGEYDRNVGYHKGVDMQAANGTYIYAAHEGVATVRSDYGAVIIYDGYNSHAYIHMSNRTTDTNISLGEYIGRQSNVSLNNISSHLHYEVRSGNSSSLGDGSATLNNLIPYGHMITNANYFSLKRQFVA